MYVNNPLDDEDKLKQEQLKKEKASVFSAAPNQNIASGSGKPNQVQPADKGSGLFTNLQQYIDANQGKSEAFASNVAQDVINKQDEAKQALIDETNTFKSSVDSQRLNADEGLLSRAEKDAGGLTKDEAAAINRNVTGSYGGPDAFTSNAGLSRINEVKDLSKTALTEDGRAKILNDWYAKNNQYATKGEMSFDKLLLGRDSGSRLAFENVANRADTISNDANNLVKSANDRVSEVRGSNQAVSNLYKDRLGKAYDSNLSAANEAVKASNKKRDDDFNAAIGQYSTKLGSEYVPEEALNGSNYVTKGADRNIYNVMTPEQQARINALASFLNREQYLGGLQKAGENFFVDSGRYNSDKAAVQKKIDEANQRAADWKAAQDRAKAVGTDLGDTAGKLASGEVSTPITPGGVSNKAVPAGIHAASEVASFVSNPTKAVSMNGAVQTLNDGVGGVATNLNNATESGKKVAKKLSLKKPLG